MPRLVGPPFRGLAPAPEEARDLVIKVKHGGILKRFNAGVNARNFDHDLAALRSKIASAFKFNPHAEFVLTYTDEEGDIVMLDDDYDLCDAVIIQKLNTLRINVELKSSTAGAPTTKQHTSNSRSPMSTALEDQLAQVKSAIDEALKFVPEQVPNVLAKISHDLHSKAASSAPLLAELLDRFAKLTAPKSNVQPSNGSSGSSCSGQQTMGKLNIKNESELMKGSVSEPRDMRNSGSSKALGLKGVLVEDIKAQVEHASQCPLVEDRLTSTSSGGGKFDRKGSAYAQSKGKSAMSSTWPPVATIDLGAPTGPNELFSFGHSYEPSGPTGKINGGFNSLFPPPPPFPHYSIWSLRDDDINDGCYNPTCTYGYNPTKPDKPPSISPYEPYYEGMYSIASPYRDLGDKHKSMPQQALHIWIQCNGCGVTPISGSRYKSNIKNDYDLCSACFYRMGNETEYTRIDRPTLASGNFRDTKKNGLLLPHFRQPYECLLIKDVSVPDGTIMAPTTRFTKIWRMRNNGSTMWPFGTCLIWVGGHQLARHPSVKLGISVDGFPVDGEIDVAVDFVAPAKPGSYISCWRLATPSGQMFGQQVWVFIEVEHPVGNSSNKQTTSINLNLPPVGSSTEWNIDMNVEPTDFLYEYPGSAITDHHESFLISDEATKPKESDFVPSTALFVLAEFKPVQVITDGLTSSAEAEMDATHGVTAPVANPLPKPVSFPASAPEAIPLPKPVSVPAPAPASLTSAAPEASAVVPAPGEILAFLEDNLLRELEFMGFMQDDLNKQLLRMNEYKLDGFINDLCVYYEWDARTELLKKQR